MPPELELKVFNSGWVPGAEIVVGSGRSFKSVRMPALFGMIRHPERGVILYDTGYHTRFYDATKKFPESLLRILTPAKLSEDLNAAPQLEKFGIKPDDVAAIVLGHGHVDHAPAIVDFPKAKVYVDSREWEFMQRPKNKIRTKGYIKSLYESMKNEVETIDFAASGKKIGPLDCAVDLWGDGTMLLTPLTGHTVGQMGLLATAGGRQYFFIGDAAWVRENYLQMRPPAFVTRGILSSFDDFKNTLQFLHDFHDAHPEVVIVPTHCPKVWKELVSSGVGVGAAE